MKRKNMTLILFVIVFILLLGAYLLIHNMNKENTESEDVSETVYETDTDDLQSITFSSDEGEYSFTKTEDTWTYAEDEEFPLNQDDFENIISSLKTISADRIIEDAEDISEYELDHPSLTVTVKKSDESEDTIEFGADNDITDGCYMMINQDSSKIYMVSTNVKSSLQFSILDLAEVEEFPSITGTTIQSVKIQNGDKEISLYKDEDSSTGWNFTDENGAQTDADSTLVTDYMNKITAFKWNSYAAPGSESEAYGFASPKKITIDYQITEESEDDSEDSKTIDKEEVLLIGNADTEGNYYAKLESQSNIYTISSSGLDEILQVTSKDFMDSYVNDYIFADLDQVTITFNHENYIFTKKVEEEEKDSEEENSEDDKKTVTKYYMNDKEISIDSFSEFYSKITGIEAQEWIGSEGDTNTEPEIAINFHKDNGIDVTTEYYTYDSNFYLVKSSKGNDALVNKMKVKEMTDALQEFLSEN